MSLRFFLISMAGLGLAACATSVPQKDLNLEQVRAQLKMAEADADLSRFAPGELQAARAAVLALEQSVSRDEEVRNHLAYMAERTIDVARARASERSEKQRLVELQRERDRILLQASLAEAERARAEAERLRQRSIATEEEALRARQDARQASERSEQSEREAMLAREEAERAQQLAQSQAREAELARKEAELAAAQASALRRQLENLQARETSRGLVYTLGDVLFETGEAELKAASLANLSRLVEVVEQYPDRNVSIEGHTDSVGSEAFNLGLSQQRADAVRGALIDAGVSGVRLKAVGLGEEFPVADNDTDFGRQQNRRVEIIILNPNS